MSMIIPAVLSRNPILVKNAIDKKTDHPENDLMFSHALSLACIHGNLEIVKLIAPHAPQKNSALASASQYGHSEIVDFLWEQSDPEQTLKEMVNDKRTAEQMHLIYSRLANELLKEEITEAVNLDKPSATKKKM